MAVAEILRIGMQMAQGLAAAHAQGLVHRDIKPANILLENGIERVKLTDFGLARAVDDASLTRSGVIAGTPLYMSPEQARGESVDHRADLFSLGCVLYTLATGRPPFRAATTLAVLRRICDDEPRPIRELNPEIPDWLAAIVGRLLAKVPDQRLGSADELAELLAGCLAHVQRPDSVLLPSAVAATSPLVSKAEVSRISATMPISEPSGSWLLTTPRGIAVLVVVALSPVMLLVLCAGLAVFAYWLTPIGTARQLNRVEPRMVRDSGRTTVSQAELDELSRLVAVAQEEFELVKARYEHSVAPITEFLQAQIDLAAAKARLAQARGDQSATIEELSKVVKLREAYLEFYRKLQQGGRVTPNERLAVERALGEARLELERARQTAP